MAWYNDVGDFMFGTAGDAYSRADDRQTGIDTQYQQGIQKLATPYQDLAATQDQSALLNEYINGLKNTDLTQYNIDPSKYAGDYKGADTLASVESYLQPKMVKNAIDAANTAIEGAAANKGGLFSGATGQAISKNSADMAQKYWVDAYDRANAANIQEDTALNQNFNQAHNANQLGAKNTTANLANKGLAYEASMDPLDTYTQMLADLYGTKYASKTNLNMGGMQAQMADTGFFDTLMATGGKLGAAAIGG